MGLGAMRAVLLIFMCIFVFGLYQTTMKLPTTDEHGAAATLIYRAQAFQALRERLGKEVMVKERELRELIDNAVEVMVPKAQEGRDGGRAGLRRSKGMSAAFGDSSSSSSQAAVSPAKKRKGGEGVGGTRSLPSVVVGGRGKEEGEEEGRGGGDTSVLLEGKGHPILAASGECGGGGGDDDSGGTTGGGEDDVFFNTPLDVFWSQYGRTLGEKNCEADFGYGLLKAWRATNATYCSPHEHGDSRLQCYLMRQNHHHGGGDNLCVGTDVSINFKELTDEEGVTRETMRRYINTRHSDAAWVHFREGFMKATCDKPSGRWVQSSFPGWNEDLLYKGLKTLPGKGYRSLSEALSCDMWVEHPVLLVERDTFANFFHDSEDFVNTFLAMAILGWRLRDAQVYLLDLYPKGPFWDIWSRVFNGGRGPKMAWDLKEEFGRANVCFKEVAVGIYGPAAPTTLASFKTECERSSLVRAYADLVIRGMGLQALTHYAQPQPSKVVTVTWMARRASVIWPERNFCGDDTFFKCDDFKHLDTRQLGRMVRNDAEVVRALRHLEEETFGNGAVVRFQDRDYNLLSFEEQIRVDLETDVMVGPHGAGLMHNVFMRDRAVLVELFIDGSGANKHFHNLAKWYGRKYVEMPSDNPVSIMPVYQQLKAIIAAMDLSKY